jgi:uncharacterized repeat protein (TIGR02059 family)
MKTIYKHFFIAFIALLLFAVNANAQESIKVGAATRQMIVYAPSGISQNRPLVISMHGRGQTMYDQKNQTQFQSVAQTNNFVLVFPQSDGNDWQLWGDNDINFILAIIDEMYNRYGIDRNRVYLSGFSMGGMMSYYAATRIADKIAAFAPVSGFLMSGPNTNSSRPVPIIHIHGADDTFVPYANVQTHMDAWIARNGCPTIPVVTSPYPANYPNAKSTKKYWGVGKEKVEVVCISVAGVGHWYSDWCDGVNGVFSSQAIWEFCSKYSLKDGLPEFKSASVTEVDPSQITVELTQPIVSAVSYTGFAVKIDGVSATVNSVVLNGTNKLTIQLGAAIVKDNEVTLSYSNGNVVSVDYEKKLVKFFDVPVGNLRDGAAPTIVEAKTDANGDKLLVKFNKAMQLPANVSDMLFKADYNGQINIPVRGCSAVDNDATMLSFSLGQKVYRDYKLSLSYSGSTIQSADAGVLKALSGLSVANIANGLPAHINSATVCADGITLSMVFSKTMALTNAQSGYLVLKANGKSVGCRSYSVSGSTIQYTLSQCLHDGDELGLDYAQQDIKAADNGPLDGFSNFTVTNQVVAPVWKSVPAKIEAENYTFKWGMQAETTSDVDGGQNLGYIADGNWLEYTIDNASSQTDFQISIRLAAPFLYGIIDYYIDDVYQGRINAPNTGNWQVFQSVVGNITIGAGKHYLKLVATKAGFNLNYFEIKSTSTGVSELAGAKVTICPNPVSTELVVNADGFRHNKIEVLDATGKLLLQQATAGEAVVKIPVEMANGLYFMRLSNGVQSQLSKFMVVN